METTRRRTTPWRAFTLVELLVVIGIIALLIGILLPALNRARKQANSVRCKAQLQQICTGFVLYNTNNNGYIVPAYNLPFAAGAPQNITGSPSQPMEGWASILDRDGYLKGSSEKSSSTVFYCPETFDIEGVKDGQTGDDYGKPRGWTDWPLHFLTVGGDTSPKEAITIPDSGYNKIFRVSYWINSYNPIGSAPGNLTINDVNYTGSVGIGPDPAGRYMRLHKMTDVKRPSHVIAVTDGCYMGRQSVGRWGQTNSRIGYRHPGPSIHGTDKNGNVMTMTTSVSVANVGFADGHVETVVGDSFPRNVVATTDPKYPAIQAENMTGPTCYSNADKIFGQ